MHDVVCYTNDVPGLIDEALALGYDNWIIEDEDGTKHLGGRRTPLVYKWPEAVALVRVDDIGSLSAFTKMRYLGQYQGETFLAAGEEELALYEKLWNPQPVEVTGELLGVSCTVYPPSKIGSFA